MKQNIFIVALLAGMLVLAGCGGGSSATPEEETETETETTETAAETTEETAEVTEFDRVSGLIAACEDEACVTAALEGIDGEEVNGDELTTLQGEAEEKNMELAAAAADQPLTEDDLTAANELVDGIAGSEALELHSSHINRMNAELENNEPWKKMTATPIGGWEARSYQIPNPEGSSGRVQDIRVWQENPVYLSQKYEDFFMADGKGFEDGDTTFGSGSSTRIVGEAATEFIRTATDMGVVQLENPNSGNFNVEAVPSNFFTTGFIFNANFDHNPDDGTAGTGRWELRGDYYDVPGIFVCGTTPSNCNRRVNPDGTNALQEYVDPDNNDTTPDLVDGVVSAPLNHDTGTDGPDPVAGIHFIPSNFSADETKVDAKWAKVQNPDFLNFGVYWTTEVTDSDAVNSISVDPFAGGGEEYEKIGDIVLSGEGVLTATYEGGAAGVYVRTMTDDNDDMVATGFGEFTADANFTAKFGATEDTVYGKISNFARVAGTGVGADPGDWTVDAGTADKPLSIGAATGSVSGPDESFHAQFQGLPNGKRQTNGHGYAPYGLVGTFQDSFDDGNATGAFGTECRGGNCTKQN